MSSRKPTAVAPTRDRLVDRAADAFSQIGYAGVSVRDLARELSVTTGAVYANFRNKGDLLAAVIDERVHRYMESLPTPTTLPGYVRGVALRHAERREMRALFLEAATAARSDPAVHAHVRARQQHHLDSWIADYRRWQREHDVDPALDMAVLTRFLWASEIGLGVLEALDLPTAKPAARAEVYARFLNALEGTGSRRPSTAADGQSLGSEGATGRRSKG